MTVSANNSFPARNGDSPKKLILRNFLSPGDLVMLTAAVRDLHQCYPGQFLTDLRTPCPELWEHNPHLVPLHEDDPDVTILDCDYPLIARSNQTPSHCLHGFIDFLNEKLNLQIKPTAFKGDIHLSDQEKWWFSQIHELADHDLPFWIIVAGGKFDVTIKWWETERYQAVVDHFKGRIQFVQVGERGHHHPKLDGVIDLRGQTDLRQLIRLVYHSQGVLCGVTAMMHLAAAVETRSDRPANRPCVVVAGGREPAHWEAYPQHQFIHTVGQLRCCEHGGCWRARTLPLGDGDERDQPDHLCVDVVGKLPRCMDMITPAEVIARIENYFHGGIARYLTSEELAAAEKAVALTASNPFDNAQTFLRTAPKGMPRAILLQQGSGLYAQMLDLTSPFHAAYCHRHNFTFSTLRGDVQFERHPCWNKILLIQWALAAGFDFVAWLDADTVILKPEADFRSTVENGAPLALCRHPLPWNNQPWHYNTGVICIRNTPLTREFFHRVWQTTPINHPWHEQLAVNQLSLEYPDLFQQLDDTWNSTVNLTPVNNPIVRAWHGKRERALKLMRKALSVFPTETHASDHHPGRTDLSIPAPFGPRP